MRTFFGMFFDAFKNLLPIVAVIAFFQLAIFGGVPDNLASIAVGMLIVVFGIALLLQGLELGVFPIGESLSNELAGRGSLFLLLLFGFCLGFSAVIAEPALIAVADQAETISNGQINSFMLRIVISLAVGLVIAFGVLRTVLGHFIMWYVIAGYAMIVLISLFAPDEVISLAYDSGAVTTNVVTVPLITAFGVGLAGSIRGRSMITDGFGLVSMALLAPIVGVLLYGIVVYSGGVDVLESTEIVETVTAEMIVESPLKHALFELLGMFRDVLPIIAVVLFFQFVILRRRLARAHHVALGFVLVIVGLYAFVVGLKLGLFPIGTSMAEQLVDKDNSFYIYLFAFALGFAVTMAEPALMVVGKPAVEAAQGKLTAGVIRIMVALGVAFGITIGAHRILTGDSIVLYAAIGFAATVAVSFVAPRYIVALACDLGGVASSVISVPLITALGIGLASQIEGRSMLIDGFGMLIFAAFMPAITVMIYAIIAEISAHFAKEGK
ncbi:membrane protein [Campylobacterota bacterium]|nr:membrane protein [Campylobacterota bacterium]